MEFRSSRAPPRSRALKLVNFIVSFLIVALGQSAWVPWLGPVAAACGYALLWRSTTRFWPTTLWFTAVQLVQISWLATLDYMPFAMVFVYLALAFLLGLQFGWVSRLTHRPLALAGGWVLLEWSRLFLFAGFPWNPVGLSLATTSASIQFASLFGVYGLSFWVFLVNALWLQRKKTLWAICALVPYVFGFVQQQIVAPSSSTLSVALVQTGLFPHEKMPVREYPGAFIPALTQWERVLSSIKPAELIVLPEASFPFEVGGAYHSVKQVRTLWKKCLRTELPATLKKRVSNGWIAQQLADHLGAQVVAGFDDYEKEHSYNAAFLFSPQKLAPERYEKRTLMPAVEYVPPFAAQFLSTHFGLTSSFDEGVEAKVFASRVPLGIAICSDEAYSDIVRQERAKGAELLVSISNDGWYPRSRLSRQHFEQGRLRAAENGAPLVRSCNTGVTGVIDCFGKSLAELPVDDGQVHVLYFDVPLRSFPTLYTFWGDRAILFLALCLLLL